MAILETKTGVAYDELFAGPEKEVFTKNVTLKSGESVTRGALLSVGSNGKAIATPAASGDDPAGVAVYVSAEAVTATADTVITVITSGYLNREKLTAAEGDTVNAHEEELRTVGIYLSSLK